MEHQRAASAVPDPDGGYRLRRDPVVRHLGRRPGAKKSARSEISEPWDESADDSADRRRCTAVWLGEAALSGIRRRTAVAGAGTVSAPCAERNRADDVQRAAGQVEVRLAADRGEPPLREWLDHVRQLQFFEDAAEYGERAPGRPRRAPARYVQPGSRIRPRRLRSDAHVEDRRSLRDPYRSATPVWRRSASSRRRDRRRMDGQLHRELRE